MEQILRKKGEKKTHFFVLFLFYILFFLGFLILPLVFFKVDIFLLFLSFGARTKNGRFIETFLIKD